MQTKDHLALGRYLARVFEIEEPVKKYAFVIGNIMPDVNKCSYIHGYFQLLRAHRQQKDAGPLSLNDHRRMLIGGHTAEGSRFFVNRVYRVLRKREKLSVRDYYQMGKATHYLADRFTYPHTMRYTSGFFAHIRYEKQLHIYMRDMLAVLPNMRDAVDKCFSGQASTVCTARIGRNRREMERFCTIVFIFWQYVLPIWKISYIMG